MFALQLALSVAVWAATVFFVYRSKARFLAWGARRSRAERALAAAGGLLVSFVVLGLGMAGLANGGLTSKGLTLPGWAFTTLVGSVFVYLQTAAMVALVLNAVTPDRIGPSDKENLDRP